MQEVDPSATRSSLIRRLHDWDDEKAWNDFFSSYWKLIYAVALKSGLTDEEARDVVQETVLSVARSLRVGQYDLAKGSFKSWLCAITRNRIIDHFRRRKRTPNCVRLSHGSSTGTTAAARVPDPASLEMNAIWDDEWRKNLVDAAIERVRAKVPPNQFQIFDLYVIKGLPVGEVAKLARTSRANVYIIKHRLGYMVKNEARRLECGWGGTGSP